MPIICFRIPLSRTEKMLKQLFFCSLLCLITFCRVDSNSLFSFLPLETQRLFEDAFHNLLPSSNLTTSLRTLIVQIHEWSLLSQDGSLCRPTVESQITTAIEYMRKGKLEDTLAELQQVKAEYNKANKKLHICGRTRFLTCNHATEKCDCGNGVKSTSAAQRENTGHRYMKKPGVKSQHCYVTSGSCKEDPTVSVMSLFSYQYKFVRSHYGDPKVGGNHLDKNGCLKNYCARIDHEKSQCIPDNTISQKYSQIED